ncbi:MAG: zinc-binding dehydrogenase [Actinomycetota bacterium]|nr:zinc-binding dehydrogenase [Actinomycetota bacterium]
MKAVTFDEHGGLEVLKFGEVDTPEPGPGEVRVAVEACSLNYHDVFTRRGMPGIKTPLPMIPGCDAAGRVDAAGAGVEGWRHGDRVLVDPVQWTDDGRIQMIGDTRWGAYAEYVIVDARQLITLPDQVSAIDASCLPVAYGTAHRMMFTRGGVKAGETVFVLGASGGVGTCCVLLAKQAGAHVIAAAGSAEKCAALEALGADESVDYSTTDIAAFTRQRTGSLFSGGGWDVVVNFTGGDTWVPTLRMVKMGGRLLTCGATAGFDPATDIRFIWTAEMDIRGSNGWKRDDLASLLAMVADGRLKPVVDKVLPLSEGAEAMRLLEDRQFFGKIVLAP